MDARIPLVVCFSEFCEGHKIVGTPQAVHPEHKGFWKARTVGTEAHLVLRACHAEDGRTALILQVAATEQSVGLGYSMLDKILLEVIGGPWVTGMRRVIDDRLPHVQGLRIEVQLDGLPLDPRLGLVGKIIARLWEIISLGDNFDFTAWCRERRDMTELVEILYTPVTALPSNT